MSKGITIDDSKCTGCMLCAKVCFLNYEAGSDGKAHALEQPVMCAACGHCVAVCPASAITHPSIDPSGIEPIDEAKRPSYDEFLSFLKMRRSRREFEDRQVPREVVDKLLTAAIQAPNGLNRQNVRYTVITDRQILGELSAKITASTAKFMRMLANPLGKLFFKTFFRNLYKEMEFFLPLMDQISKIEGLDVVMYDAPCLIMIHTPKNDMCGNEDSLYCGANILLAVETLGLGACVIGFVTGTVNSDPNVRKLAGVPEGSKVHTSIVVGYPKFRYPNSAPKEKAEVDYLGS